MNTVQSDFFSNHFGRGAALESRPPHVWRAKDLLHDLGLLTSSRLRAIRRQAAQAAPRKVLIAGIEVPSRAADIHRVIADMSRGSHHSLTVSTVVMGNSGKFQNIERALAAAPPLPGFDWLIITDDDIAFARGFLDDLIALAEASGMSLLQPAHRFRSHASYAITRRSAASLVRETRFVEIGPLTLIKADVFDKLIPFPDSRWCYGIDLVWSEVLRRGGHRLGIVDGAPVEHLRPVALSYDIDSAIAEGQALMRRFDVQTSRGEFLSGDRIVIATR
jgi:hypothetical protein